MELTHAKETAVRLAREAGALLLDGFSREITIERKSSDVDWVTEYDKAAEDLIVNRLTTIFPDHGIVAEEGSERTGNGRYTWYVDPLDGTNNFAHRFPVFCVSIGLYEGNTPLVGVVYDPARDECFTAVRGQGAFVTDRTGVEQPLRVSQTAALGDALLATGFPYDRQTNPQNNVAEVGAFIRQCQGIRRPGSAALDITYVAAGRLDGYWEYRLYCWDMAAARAILEEAGGRITMIDGAPVRMDRQLSLVVSNGRIHQQMHDVLKEVT